MTGASVSGYVPGHLDGSHLQQRDDGHGEWQHRQRFSGNISDTVDMTAGATITYTVTGTIASGATGSLANTATCLQRRSIPTTSNDSATDTDTLTPQADLSISKDDGQTTAIPGDTVTYTIVVTNNGLSDVTGATVSDTFPGILSGVTYSSVTTGTVSGNTASGSAATSATPST